jgi:hypothetical protein
MTSLFLSTVMVSRSGRRVFVISFVTLCKQGERAIYAESNIDTGDRWRSIQRIIGRDNNYAILGDGVRRSFIPYYEALDVVAELKRFRIGQVEPDLFDILILADQDYFDRIKTQALAPLRDSPGIPTTFGRRDSKRSKRKNTDVDLEFCAG